MRQIGQFLGIQAFLLFLGLTGIFAFCQDALAVPTNLISFRHFSTRGYTRLVLVLSRKTLRFRAENMSAPPRVVLEIPSGHLKSNVRVPQFGQTSLVRKLSVHRTAGNNLRVIIHLAHGKIRHNVFSLPDPHRIVIDLRESKIRNGKAKNPKNLLDVKKTPEGHIRQKNRVKRAPPRNKEQSREALDLATRFRSGLGRVVLDPGHGGRDPGTTGMYGLVEKKLVLDISHRISARLRRGLPRGNKIFLTRTRDRVVSLEKRTSIANDFKADVFVSIHVNSSPQKHTRGVETYLLSEASTPRALELAAIESGTTVSKMSDLQKILNDLMLRSKVDESLQLAEKIQSSMIGRLRQNYKGVTDLGVKRGPFYVLVGASMASVLTEIAFVSNPTEARRLRTSKYRQAIAEGIAEGIANFVGVPLRRKRVSFGHMEAHSPRHASQ